MSFLSLNASKVGCLLAVSAFSLAVQPAIAASRNINNAAKKQVAASSATILGGNLVIGGKAISLPGELTAAGSAPPAYSSTMTSNSLHKTVTFSDGIPFRLSAGRSIDVAVSAGQQGLVVVSAAGSSIQSPSVTISDVLTNTAFTLSATQVESTASFAKSTVAAPVATGSTTLAGLKIDMSLLGLGVVKYTGKPKPNTILYKAKNGSVIIYLNRQTTTTGAALDRPDASAATSITVDAVDIHLVDAEVAGYTVSGDIRIGISYAE
jgi:hypothetical protein